MGDAMDVFARLRCARYFDIAEVTDLKVVDASGRTLLQAAIASRPEFALPLVGMGVPLDHQDRNGQTALQYAIARSMVEVAHALLLSGADPKVLDVHGNGALWTAVMSPRPDAGLVRSLLDAGCDPCLRNKAGRSVEDMLRSKDHAVMLEMLGVTD